MLDRIYGRVDVQRLDVGETEALEAGGKHEATTFCLVAQSLMMLEDELVCGW